MNKDLASFKIDFASLEAYRDVEHDDLPIYSFISIYEQIGIYDFIQKYYEENNMENGTFSYIDNIFAHPDTILKMRHLVKHNWETFDISIDRDQHVFWKPNSHYGKVQHYVKKLNKNAAGAVDRDFLDCCPGTDPTLELDTIVIRVSEPDEVEAIDASVEDIQ